MPLWNKSLLDVHDAYRFRCDSHNGVKLTYFAAAKNCSDLIIGIDSDEDLKYYQDVFLRCGIPSDKLDDIGEVKCNFKSLQKHGLRLTDPEHVVLALHALGNENIRTEEKGGVTGIINNYFRTNRATLEKMEDNSPLKKIYNETCQQYDEKSHLNNLITKYSDSGKKFGVFAQHKDRMNVITKLGDLQPIFDKKILNKEDYLEIAKKVETARVETLSSHRSSLSGKLGLTDSRFEKQLNRYLNDMVTRGKITAVELT